MKKFVIQIFSFCLSCNNISKLLSFFKQILWLQNSHGLWLVRGTHLAPSSSRHMKHLRNLTFLAISSSKQNMKTVTLLQQYQMSCPKTLAHKQDFLPNNCSLHNLWKIKINSFKMILIFLPKQQKTKRNQYWEKSLLKQ